MIVTNINGSVVTGRLSSPANFFVPALSIRRDAVRPGLERVIQLAGLRFGEPKASFPIQTATSGEPIMRFMIGGKRTAVRRNWRTDRRLHGGSAFPTRPSMAALQRAYDNA